MDNWCRCWWCHCFDYWHRRLLCEEEPQVEGRFALPQPSIKSPLILSANTKSSFLELRKMRQHYNNTLSITINAKFRMF